MRQLCILVIKGGRFHDTAEYFAGLSEEMDLTRDITQSKHFMGASNAENVIEHLENKFPENKYYIVVVR
jgi:hypothetical protein